MHDQPDAFVGCVGSQIIDVGTAFDPVTITANTNVMVFNGDIADSSALTAALNDGGSTDLKFEGATTINGAILALKDKGSQTTLALVSSALGLFEEGASSELVVIELTVFRDIADTASIISSEIAPLRPSFFFTFGSQ